jgi:hypothetical protein
VGTGIGVRAGGGTGTTVLVGTGVLSGSGSVLGLAICIGVGGLNRSSGVLVPLRLSPVAAQATTRRRAAASRRALIRLGRRLSRIPRAFKPPFEQLIESLPELSRHETGHF